MGKQKIRNMNVDIGNDNPRFNMDTRPSVLKSYPEKRVEGLDSTTIVLGRLDDLGRYFALADEDLSEKRGKPTGLTRFARELVERDYGCGRFDFAIARLKDDDAGFWRGNPDEDDPDTYFSDGIYVLPEFRGRGIGTALEADQIDHARIQQYTHFRTIIKNDNVPSLVMSHKLGLVLESKDSVEGTFVLKL